MNESLSKLRKVMLFYARMPVRARLKEYDRNLCVAILTQTARG